MKKRFEIIAGDINVGGEIVIDKKTGLHWTKRPLGGEFTFDEATKIRRGDWRVPTAEELSTILDYSCEIPACSREFEFTTEAEMLFWTSSSYIGDPYYSWYVNFYDGSIGYTQRDTEFAVRLVKEIKETI